MANRIDLMFLTLASLCMLAGVVIGLVMGVREDFTLAPVHGHLNLMGWVSLALYGLTYRAYPRLGDMRSRWVHLALSGGGAILFPVGLSLELQRGESGLLMVAAPLWLVGAGLFCSSVVRHLVAGADALPARGSPGRSLAHDIGGDAD